MKIKKPNLIVILGPTASGKTRLGAKLAEDMGSEIISADSRQVYRGMDIGTGKDLKEFIIDGKPVPYHLIDIIDPDYEFNVFEYQKRFFACFAEITSRGIIPIMIGGSGLYIESALRGYRMLEVPKNSALREKLETEKTETLTKRLIVLNPALHNTTDLKNKKRLIRAIEIALYTKNHSTKKVSIPRINPLIIGVRWDRKTLRQMITTRLRKRLEMGMIDEARNLHASGVSFEKLEFFGLEYRYISLYLQNKLNKNDMFQKLSSNIHQFAKRQETWFRRMERQGFMIHWIDGADYVALKKSVTNILHPIPDKPE